MENEKIESIREGFETAYINKTHTSNLEFKPSFISNNPKEGKKVISSIEEELLKCDEFQISVAFITMTGLTPLLLILKELEKRKIPGKILTTNYLNFSEPKALAKINELSNITIKMYDTENSRYGFHTKGYIFKTDEIYRIIIGSSNITASALTSNLEWNTKIISTEQGEVTNEIIKEFNNLWASNYSLDFNQFYEPYKKHYKLNKQNRKKIGKLTSLPIEKNELKPNSMQRTFIKNLRKILDKGETKALLISATGTGKTFASAFAMHELGFKRILFVVHRSQLADQAMKSYEKIFDNSVKMGIVGSGKHEYNSDFVFAMVETLHRDQHLFKYKKDDFDCIILDEAHHSPANTYQKIMNYFTPKLFLGMTATPDKRDDHIEGRNVYELFNHQIALEIRLQKAMEEGLLCPFHYFGISDIAVIDDKIFKKKKISDRDFNLLTSEERVNQIIKNAEYYGFSGERVKGLIFCSRNKECGALSEIFNNRGYRTIALSSNTPQKIRESAFERLAMNEEDATDDFQPLDYIFSVDILNEGVDIVEVNQIIMLRPTQSPIVFIQQLGRGLRKAEGKEYVVILDFIGNYSNNFMIPVALSGDSSYNVDTIRKYVISGNSTIPGASTIHFDEISKEKIFYAIDHITDGTLKKLIKDGYLTLKNKLGKQPMLVDFYNNNEIDPLVIIKEYKTYYALVDDIEKTDTTSNLSNQEQLTIEYLSKTILSGVRPEELEILRLLLNKHKINYSEIINNCKDLYNYKTTYQKIESAYNVLKGRFVRNSSEQEKFDVIDILESDDEDYIKRTLSYEERLYHKEFYDQIEDIVSVGLSKYRDNYTQKYNQESPFILYEKYSRKDVCLLMDVEKDISSTMYGMAQIRNDVFIFVTYHKVEAIEDDKEYLDGKPDYADEFIDNLIFRWDSQIGNDLNSKYMDKVLNTPRKHLLVKKSDEESNFFYMGKFDIIDKYQDQKKNNKGQLKPICKLKFKLHNAVREDLLKYLKNNLMTEENIK